MTKKTSTRRRNQLKNENLLIFIGLNPIISLPIWTGTGTGTGTGTRIRPDLPGLESGPLERIIDRD
jgi:hypothetical protein